MHIDFFNELFEKNASSPAIIWKDKTLDYSWILNKIERSLRFLSTNGVKSGEVVALRGDFTPTTICLLMALIENQNIIVPFNLEIKETDKQKFTIAQVEKIISIDIASDQYSITETEQVSSHEYYQTLQNRKVPGLVLFTSGTSGKPKGAVHDFTKLLKKFKIKRTALRTVNFLLFDHWGGLNTLFHTLSNAGVVLATKERKPEEICSFIEKYKIELLPTSPTFLNLLILSEVYKQYDLSSLKLITYGTEPMPGSTLTKAKSIFREVQFQQTYGLIELGVLRSKSKSDDSLWVKVGGEGFELRVVENILQIKADSAMLGYLNAPSPFTEDGYFDTGDFVEQDGEYLKILGRKSEIINVGGEKVYPQEVENAILEFENVLDVTVYGEKHAITGNIVCAKVSVNREIDKAQFIRELKSFCKQKMQSFKVPIKISIEEENLHTDRYKKRRQL